MEAKERIIRRMLAQQRCHRCGDHFEPESRIVLARRREVWMVMASCSFCEQMDTFIVQFPSLKQGRRRVTSYRLSRPPSQSSSESIETPTQPEKQAVPVIALITHDDVREMHHFLESFDGDFRRLFAEIE